MSQHNQTNNEHTLCGDVEATGKTRVATVRSCLSEGQSCLVGKPNSEHASGKKQELSQCGAVLVGTALSQLGNKSCLSTISQIVIVLLW